MTVPAKPTPPHAFVYVTIANQLRESLAAGQFLPGDRLPSERELCEQFGVARMTVRKALDILHAEGVIERRRGRAGGTFVRHIPPTVEVTRMDGYLPQLRERGWDIQSRILAAGEIAADPEVAQALRIGEGDPVFNISRLRLIGGLPTLIENSYFPREGLPFLVEQDLTQSLYELLDAYHRRPVRKWDLITPVTPTEEQQDLLGVTRATLLLQLTRIAEDRSGTVVEYSRDVLRSDTARVIVSSGDVAGDPPGLISPRTLAREPGSPPAPSR
ncbi:GntR family transcriptional regulator [Corynebacterium guangdongense]|uniref:GntR family transcriptional regulator n=1 Tax=Corynebacterium guangdongense TaxID=1783348 RepID=A0ABU1ZTV6_9CORY|nr:GntR family transcriptional regulator [Corynebacterium guangdongense]MDR7328358.1 GntR family transcriptional regulator [Corynebacterium guangdongense]WJZ16935.1 HTH-type transcriptional repressor YvoA [Corynebacterium guangdongense]